MQTVIPGSSQSNRDRAELVALRRLGKVEDCAKVVSPARWSTNDHRAMLSGMLPRSAETDAFWESLSPPSWARPRQLRGWIVRRHPGDGDRTGRFGHRRDQEDDGELGTGLQRRSRADTKARRFRHHARRPKASTVHLANHRGND